VRKRLKFTGIYLLRKIVAGCFVAQRPPTLCCAYEGNSSGTEMWSSRPSTIQYRLCTFWFSSVWTLEGGLEMSPIYSAWLAPHSTKNVFFWW
jgi:hypothetical protein